MLYHLLPTVKSSSNHWVDEHLYLPEWDIEKDGPMDASISDKRPMFSKDSWQYPPSVLNATGSVKHKTYTRVYDANVPNIPGHDFNIIGDLPNGDTRMQELIDSELYVRASITLFKHYRLVLSVVGRDLTTFTSTKELLTAVRDAMQAHWEAFVIVKLLHRDISTGNIIIYDGGGLLIDWEVAKDVSEVGGRRHDRTGTWQFTSAASLQDLGKKRDLTDELESFLHVLGWTVLRYLPGVDTYVMEDRRHDLGMFDETSRRPSHVTGGGIKADKLGGGSYPSLRFKPKAPTPLWSLIRTLVFPFKCFYAGQPPTAEQRKRYQKILESNAKPAFYVDNIVYLYDLSLERLKSSKWFLDTIDLALEKPAFAWPTDDKADPDVHIPMQL